MEDLGLTHASDGGIGGWIYPDQLTWLSEQASKHYRILEIGSWRGRSTVALGSATSGNVWAVDHWLGGDEETDGQLAIYGTEGVYQNFLRNTAPYPNIVPVRASSEEAWWMLNHLRFDMVWIDGDHTYEGVRDDIRRWKALLSPGGFICGHDAEYDSVDQAVKELLTGVQYWGFGNPVSVIWGTHGA